MVMSPRQTPISVRWGLFFYEQFDIESGALLPHIPAMPEVSSLTTSISKSY